MKTAHFLKLDKKTSQNLALDDLDYTTSYARAFKLEQILIHADVAISETVTITLDSVHGSSYDTVLKEVTLVAETDFVYEPLSEKNFQAGDEIRVQVTNANLTGTVYAVIRTSEM